MTFFTVSLILHCAQNSVITLSNSYFLALPRYVAIRESSSLLRLELLVVPEDDSPELPAEEAVHEGVDHGVAVSDPQDDGIGQGRRVQLQKTGQGHPTVEQEHVNVLNESPIDPPHTVVGTVQYISVR